MPDEQKAMEIKRFSRRSYPNLRAAARLLQGKDHEPFSTKTVRWTSISYTRKIARDAQMTFEQIERWADKNRRAK